MSVKNYTMETTEYQNFIEIQDEKYSPDQRVIMKEELIINDVANQDVSISMLDNVTHLMYQISSVDIPNIETKTEVQIENVNLEEKFKNVEHINKVIEIAEEDEDEIVIISEEKPTVSKKKQSQQSVIIPEIAQQMLRIKIEMQKGNKVPLAIVFVKKCRLCQKVQKESRSQSMIKCENCDSRCFLFQCLLCFKRYTTVNEIFNHVDKKHSNSIIKDNVKKRLDTQHQQQQQEQKQQLNLKLSPKGIKVKSNKCLTTNEKFQFKINNGLTQMIPLGQSSSTRSTTKSTFEKEGLETETIPEIILKEDVPLKQVESELTSGESLFRCDHCNYKSTFRRYFQEHMQRRHSLIDPENYHNCSTCDKRFRLLKDLKPHENICGKAAHLQCKFCSYKTRHNGTLKVHMQTHFVDSNDSIDSNPSTSTLVRKPTASEIKHGMQAYCSSCDRSYKPVAKTPKCVKCQNLYLFRCKLCTHASSRYNDEYQHVRRVHYSRPKKQCPKCKKFVVDVKTHEKYCGVEPSFKCEHCDFKTKRKHTYVSHMKIKHEIGRDNWYTCDKCNKQFAILRYLNRHQRIFCDNVPRYGCAHCCLKTRSKGNLIRHIRLLHSDTLTDVKFTCKNCNIEYYNFYMYDKHVKHCLDK